MATKRTIRYKGSMVLMNQLCKKHGISTSILDYRMTANPKVAVENLLYPSVDPNVYYMIKGERLSCNQICERYHLRKTTWQGRINRYYDGTNAEELTYPVGAPKKKYSSEFLDELHEYAGQLLPLRDWIKISGTNTRTFMTRMKKYDMAFAMEAKPYQRPFSVKAERKRSKPLVIVPVSERIDTHVKKTKKHNRLLPDLSHLEWEEDLEAQRQIDNDIAAGYTDEEILIRRKRSIINV